MPHRRQVAIRRTKPRAGAWHARERKARTPRRFRRADNDESDELDPSDPGRGPRTTSRRSRRTLTSLAAFGGVGPIAFVVDVDVDVYTLVRSTILTAPPSGRGRVRRGRDGRRMDRKPDPDVPCLPRRAHRPRGGTVRTDARRSPAHRGGLPSTTSAMASSFSAQRPTHRRRERAESRPDSGNPEKRAIRVPNRSEPRLGCPPPLARGSAPRHTCPDHRTHLGGSR